MKRKFGYIKILSALCLLIILASGISSCEKTDFKVMSVKEGIHGFTFEYPNNYNLIHLSLENSPLQKYSEVGLSSLDGNSYSEIYVYIWFPDSELSSAELITNKLVENGRNSLNDFTLVNETTLMLGDNPARQAVFTADSNSAYARSDNLTSNNMSISSPRPATYRITSMIYSGLAVEIDMTCDTAITDATADNYQHILDTFAILD